MSGADAGVQRQAAWREVRRVLAVRLDQLGDVIMTTPALAAIKDSVPGVHLTLLTSASGALAARHVPFIDETLVYEAPWVKTPVDVGAEADLALIQRLAEGRFDAAVIFTVCTQNPLPAALMCRLAGIPLRLAHCRENPYHLLSDWVPDRERVEDGMRHEVARQLDLVATVGWRPRDERLVFRYTPDEQARVARHLQALGIAPGAPYMVVHPGATAPSRRYPPEQFGRAVDQVWAHAKVPVVFTGSPGEAELIEAARAAMSAPSHSLVGRLSLGELGALLAGARLLLSNNTGPVHMAAALGTPVVDLYALTNPQHTPWKVPARVLNHDVPCRHCLKSVCPQGHQACLRQVTPEEVARASLELLALSL